MSLWCKKRGPLFIVKALKFDAHGKVQGWLQTAITPITGCLIWVPCKLNFQISKVYPIHLEPGILISCSYTASLLLQINQWAIALPGRLVPFWKEFPRTHIIYSICDMEGHHTLLGLISQLLWTSATSSPTRKTNQHVHNCHSYHNHLSVS